MNNHLDDLCERSKTLKAEIKEMKHRLASNRVELEALEYEIKIKQELLDNIHLIIANEMEKALL